MTTEIIPKGQIGFKILVTLMDEGAALDVSTATTKKLYIKKPSGTTMEKTAVFETTGADGKIYYLTILNDLNESGWYSFRGYIETNVFKGYSHQGWFYVEEV